MAGEGCDSNCTGRTILGGRARTPGLFGKISERIYVSLHPTRVEGRLTKPRVCRGDAWSTERSEIAKVKKTTMRATASLRDLGQSIWLDNITRDLLNKGVLKHYIDEL